MSFRVRRIREFLARALRPTRKKVVIAVLAVVVLGVLIFWNVRMRGSVQPGGVMAAPSDMGAAMEGRPSGGRAGMGG